MKIPESIREAIAKQSQACAVIEAQRARDAEVWGMALMYRRKNGYFRRTKQWCAQYAECEHFARAAADKARAWHGDRAIRALLDLAYSSRHNGWLVFIHVLAIHIINRKGRRLEL